MTQRVLFVRNCRASGLSDPRFTGVSSVTQKILVLKDPAIFGNRQQPAEAGHPGLTGMYQHTFRWHCTRMFWNSPYRETKRNWERNLSSPYLVRVRGRCPSTVSADSIEDHPFLIARDAASFSAAVYIASAAKKLRSRSLESAKAATINRAHERRVLPIFTLANPYPKH